MCMKFLHLLNVYLRYLITERNEYKQVYPQVNLLQNQGYSKFLQDTD